MCDELRELHDRIGATTVYVTHDQLEAMSMADRIAVMNRGIVEQIGAPQEIYDRPATMFVAEFIGSPPMNFLPFAGNVRRGDRTVQLRDAIIAVPEIYEDMPTASLALGVRPEHVFFSDDAPIRGRVFGTEYLGTTQIVTVEAELGRIKARLPARLSVRLGETVGLAFQSERLVVFDTETGRAAQNALYEGDRHG
jgi:multiple sugar transport system ATP-binding protein